MLTHDVVSQVDSGLVREVYWQLVGDADEHALVASELADGAEEIAVGAVAIADEYHIAWHTPVVLEVGAKQS